MQYSLLYSIIMHMTYDTVANIISTAALIVSFRKALCENKLVAGYDLVGREAQAKLNDLPCHFRNGYFLPAKRLKRLFANKKTKMLRWHAKKYLNDEKLKHPADGSHSGELLITSNTRSCLHGIKHRS